MASKIYTLKIKTTGEIVKAYQWAKGKYFVNYEDQETKYHWDEVDVL